MKTKKSSYKKRIIVCERYPKERCPFSTAYFQRQKNMKKKWWLERFGDKFAIFFFLPFICNEIRGHETLIRKPVAHNPVNV